MPSSGREALRFLGPWAVLLAIFVRPAALLAAEPAIEFNRDIRPILSENCFACHGPDARKREAGLRLDRPEGAILKLESGGVAIVAGKPGESELVRRIESTDDDVRMPPADSIKHLTPEQVQLLKAWIAAGAEYQGHWSYLPIRPQPPAAGEPRSSNPIDGFVLAELGRHGLGASPPADPITLARRLAFDLTGLPPTPEQVARLAADAGDASYERLVDELLASPRYGERMAMWWLDLVRYADSVGYHGDQPVNVYPFREYVIRAFNDNKRFDQFTIEQLAGDLLPEATPENKIASGYNRLGMMSEEGGVQPKEYLAKYIAERVRNANGTWLGLTLGCAECHDHKFDPLTTKDFYRFEAFFADIQERGLYGPDFGPSIQLPTPEQATQLAGLIAEISAIEAQVNQTTPELEQAQAEWERSLGGGSVNWVVLRPTSAVSKEGATLKTLDDASVLAGDKPVGIDTYTLTADTDLVGIRAVRLEALADPSLPAQGPGRAGNGNFVLSEFRVTAAPKVDPLQQAKPAVLENATADHSQDGYAVAAAIDNNSGTGWAIMPATGKGHAATFAVKEPLGAAGGTTLTFTLDQNHGSGHAIGRLRLAVSTDNLPAPAGGNVPAPIQALLAIVAAERTPEQRQALAVHYRSIAPALEPVRQKLAATKKSRDDLNNQVPNSLITVAVAPRPIRVLPRGNWMDDAGEEVQPGVPAMLPQPPTKEGRLTRLDLAQWLVARNNPLPSRVLTNRLWKLFFGAGLSGKLDDLGAQGQWPTHPELLDWLSADLLEGGWDVKRTIKSIVMSKTYRQSSLVSADAKEKDPYNRWVARQSRFRRDAETVRDAALWISGLLVERIGGPSVKPYQPPRYWAYLNFPEREWQNGVGDDLYRRGLYTHWQRQYLHPSLLAFDAPSREECTADRPRSNTPLQSLVLLNDPTYVEAARVFAELIVRQGGSSPAERLDYALRRALSRGAAPIEAQILTDLLTKHQEYFKQNPAAATELLSVGARPRASDLDPLELAAWTSVARAILNLHAVVTRN